MCLRSSAPSKSTYQRVSHLLLPIFSLYSSPLSRKELSAPLSAAPSLSSVCQEELRVDGMGEADTGQALDGTVPSYSDSVNFNTSWVMDTFQRILLFLEESSTLKWALFFHYRSKLQPVSIGHFSKDDLLHLAGFLQEDSLFRDNRGLCRLSVLMEG